MRNLEKEELIHMQDLEKEEQTAFDNIPISAGLVHLILVGTSKWAWSQISFADYPWAKLSFAATLGHGALGLGIYLWSKQNLIKPTGKKMEHIYNRSSMIVRSIPMLCYNLEFLGIRILNSFYTLVPILNQIKWTKNEQKEEKLWNCFNVLNLLLMIYLSLIRKDPWLSGLVAVGTMSLLSKRYSSSGRGLDNLTGVYVSMINVLGSHAILASIRKSQE